MNSMNSKTSDPHKLLLNLSDKINFKRNYNYVALSSLSIYYTWKKILKSHTKKINLKHQLQHRMNSVNYLMDHILYRMFKITFNIS